MRRRLAVLVAAAFVSVLGTASCGGGVEQEVREQVDQEIQEGRDRVEKEIQKGRTRLGQEIEEGRTQIAKEIEGQ